MAKGGLLIGGIVHSVAGLDIVNPVDGPSWCKLDPGDGRRRRTPWVRQVIVHGTRGGWPQNVLPGAGKGDRAKVVADFWRGDPTHSAAHLIVDTDGKVACLCDLASTTAFHATVSNEWSVGIEMAQLGAGDVYEATLGATVRLVAALCDLLGIPKQMPDRYEGRPLKRLLDGGPDFAGVYGHRHNTDRRGRGDPGDAVFLELAAAGFERFDLDTGADLAAWKRRQAKLGVKADGIVGPGTMAALRAAGYASGRELDAAVEAPLRDES